MRTTKFVLCFILLVGVQVSSTDLDKALETFIASTIGKSAGGSNSDAIQNLFNLYKKEFNRKTQTTNEEKLRLDSFSASLNTLVDHHRQGEKAYTLGLNNHSDWTQDELTKLNGVRVPQGNILTTNAKAGQRFTTWDGKIATGKTSLPTSYDYTTRVASGTNVPVVQPIKDQGNCGSCYTFAFISLLEFQYAVQLKASQSLSEQQMVDCSTKDNGCNGGYFTNTFTYLQNNLLQVNTESYYPYKAVKNTCIFKATGPEVKYGSLLYNTVTTNNAAAMQQALVNYGPLWVSVFAGNSSSSYKQILSGFGSYKSGIWQPSGCPTSLASTNHAVVIVGYGVDATTNIPYWKVRNSWGTSWGEAGYFRIQSGVNMCGIESGPFYIAKPA
ncbi:unnamed protein product [Adineta steineri]|uniref:Uncharacterized protein n=1 Tax=Adineta steineri TaxID=433720 RepID=A0A816DPX6_9BILA|nr:unnamed protein product [Adineta steineri]CAF1636782.1 unnamed protein product [Adineta steineri]